MDTNWITETSNYLLPHSNLWRNCSHFKKVLVTLTMFWSPHAVAFLFPWHIKFKKCLLFEQSVVEKLSCFVKLVSSWNMGMLAVWNKSFCMHSACACVVMSHGGAGAAASVPVWPPPDLTQTSLLPTYMNTRTHILIHMHTQPYKQDGRDAGQTAEHVHIHIPSHKELQTFNKMMKSIHVCC